MNQPDDPNAGALPDAIARALRLADEREEGVIAAYLEQVLHLARRIEREQR